MACLFLWRIMTVYVELIFLSNLCIDAFIFCLVNTVLKLKNNISRIIWASFIGGICSSIYPFIGIFRIFMKILLALILPLIFRKPTTFKDYLITLSSFLCVSFLLAGCVLMLNGFSINNLTFNPIIYGIFPILFCSSGFIITLLAGNIIHKLMPQRLKNGNLYKATIQNENAKVSCVAYYDSGNRVFDNNGGWVIFVNDDIYKKLMPASESCIIISTINGKSVVKTTKASIKIYLGEFENKIYKVSIALGNMLNINQKILLHAEMLGG